MDSTDGAKDMTLSTRSILRALLLAATAVGALATYGVPL